MAGWRLFWWVLWRGLLSGTLLGALFLQVGLFDGAVLGAVFGIINGIALVLLRHICFTPLIDQHRYRWTALLVAIAATIGMSFLWASAINASLELTLMLTVVAAVAASVFVWQIPVPISRVAEVRHSLPHAVLFYAKK